MRFLALLFLAIGCAGLSASASPATFVPEADAFVDSAQAGKNYGAAGALGVAASGKPKGEFDSFLRFDLTGLSENVQAISLQLTAAFPMNGLFNAASAGSFTIRWLQNDSFVEGTGMPNSPDTAAAHVNFTNTSRGDYFSAVDESLGTFSFNGSTSGAVTFNLALTPGFLADVEAHGLVTLYLAAADENIAYLFNSTNFTGDPASKPMLMVNPVPEPGVSSFLFAGVGLLGRRRKPRA